MDMSSITEGLIATGEELSPVVDRTSEAKLENLSMMQKIANNDQTFNDIKMLTSSKVTDQMKVFLVSQAKNELNRVIKLTTFLDALETSYINKVTGAIESDSLSLKNYGDIIETITECLNRSNTIISQIIKDDSLMTILNTTIYAGSGTATSASVGIALGNAQSRERVRTIITQVLNRTDLTEEDNLVEVIEEKSEENTNE